MASKISINLDTSKESYILTKCKQDDDLTLEAMIYENGLALDLTNKEIFIKALKADGTYINQSTGITKANNKMLADLIRDFSRVPGTTKIEILLVEGGKNNTTFSFFLEVVGSVVKGAVESTNTVTILEELDNKVIEAGQVKAETEQLIQSGGAATKGDIALVNSSLEQKAQKTDVAIQGARIDNLVAHSTDTGNNSELIDIRVSSEGIVEDSAGSSIRNQIRNFNGYNLTRGNPISDDITNFTIDGKFYNYDYNFDTTPRTLASVYTGVVDGIIPNTKYRVQVYALGDKTLSICNFYNSNGVLISQDLTNFYGYKVINVPNRIVEFTAPPNATKMTYTNYLVDKSKGFCKKVIDKLSVDWLRITENNFNNDIVKKLNSSGNALQLTTTDKLSSNVVSLYEWGYYLSASGDKITNANMGTGYFNAVGEQKYRIKVYDVTPSIIQGNYAVIYFWTKSNQLITPATYSYTVVDAVNRIIEITAPLNATKGTITYKNDVEYFVYQVGGKTSYDWLVINENNFNSDIKNKLFNNLKYEHCLDKPFNFQGKSITFFGDSITAGVTSPSLAVTTNSYARLFANKFSMPYDNRAVSGSAICDTTNSNSILNTILNYTTQRDFIFIAGGTNDWTLGKPVGVLGDTTGETFYGALHLICQHLKTNHSNTKVIFITPINQNVSRPNAITTMDVYRNAIFEVATSNGFNVVDGSKIGFPKEQGAFANSMCSDGVHPSELGHTFYAKSLCGILA